MSNNYHISGRVTSKEGRPVPDARVIAISEDDKIFETQSDFDGYYKFEDLDPNKTYNLMAEGKHNFIGKYFTEKNYPYVKPEVE